MQLLSEGTRNYTNRQTLLKDKFTLLIKQGQGLQGGEQQFTASLEELKKNDFFDLGVLLTICATGGLDMVSEEQIAKLSRFNQSCCLIHALNDVDTSKPDFDTSLLATLLTLRSIFSRISPTAQEFICLCMQ